MSLSKKVRRTANAKSYAVANVTSAEDLITRLLAVVDYRSVEQHNDRHEQLNENIERHGHQRPQSN